MRSPGTRRWPDLHLPVLFVRTGAAGDPGGGAPWGYDKGIAMSDGYEAFRKAVEQYFPGGFTLRDEANAIVACAFRNGSIEDLHAGESSELLENPDLSRITDDEMKRIMVNACQCVEKLLQEKQENPDAYYQKILEYNLKYCRNWDR